MSTDDTTAEPREGEEPEPTLSQEVWREAQETAAAIVNKDEVPEPKQGASFETEQPEARINPNVETDDDEDAEVEPS